MLKSDKGTVDTFIGRSTKNRTMMAVTNDGRRAVTHYEVIKRYGAYTLCRFKLETGRTHQIRVHLSHIGYPVVGDYTYSNGKNDFNVEGQMLHSKKIKFKHPKNNKIIELLKKEYPNIIPLKDVNVTINKGDIH